MNEKNEEVKRTQAPFTVDNLFPAPNGDVLLRGEDRVALFDVQQKCVRLRVRCGVCFSFSHVLPSRFRRVTAELTVNDVKLVFWSNDANLTAALVNKDCTRPVILSIAFCSYLYLQSPLQRLRL